MTISAETMLVSCKKILSTPDGQAYAAQALRKEEGGFGSLTLLILQDLIATTGDQNPSLTQLGVVLESLIFPKPKVEEPKANPHTRVLPHTRVRPSV